MLTDEEAVAAQRRVWALIFNHRSDNEGIYTQQRGDGREYVLTYCEELLLAQAGCFPRTPLRTMRRRLAGACKSALLLEGEAVPSDVAEALRAFARGR